MWKGVSSNGKEPHSKDRIKSQMLRDPSLVLAAPAKWLLLSPWGAKNLSSSHFFSGPAHSRDAG